MQDQQRVHGTYDKSIHKVEFEIMYETHLSAFIFSMNCLDRKTEARL